MRPTHGVRLVTFCAAAAALDRRQCLPSIRRRRQVSKLKSCSGRQDRDWPSPRGRREGGGYLFRGLPYAAAPIGQLRWQPPQLRRLAHGVRDATQFAPSCPQSVVDALLPAQSDRRGPVPQRLHAVSAQPPRRWSPGARVDPRGRSDARMPPATTTAPSSRRRALSSSRSTTGWARSALRTRRSPSRPGGSTGNYGWMDQQAACGGSSATSHSSAATRTT